MTAGKAHDLGAVYVLAAAILWGTTGTAATFAPGVSPLAIGAVAMGFGGFLQLLMALGPLKRQWHLLRSQQGCLWAGALAVAVYPLAFYSSMHLAGVTVGTVVTIGSAPLFSALIERLFDNRRLDRRWMLGAALGVGGALLLCLAESKGQATGMPSALHSVVGVCLGLLAGLTYALYSWTAHRIMRQGVSSRAAMGATFGLGGVLLMPVLLVTGEALLQSWNGLAVGLYMVLVPMFLGYVLFGLGLARVTASTATTLSLVEPVVAALLAVVIVGERLPLHGWLGVALVIGCLYVLTRQAGEKAAG